MDMAELIAEVRGLRADVTGIREELGHYRGFVAGVVWCFAAISGAIGFVWGLLMDNG